MFIVLGKPSTVLILTLLLINQALVYANSPTPRPETPEFATARAAMVETQLKPRGIKNASVLNAMGKVQRHEFIPEKYRGRSYEDSGLPIGRLQTISQPYMVALMTEEIKPKRDMKVLEIGTGTGYSAAILAEIVDEVYSIEIDPGLAKTADERLKRLGYTNTFIKAGDGFFGWPNAAPFDAIIITCAVDKVPPRLAEQLKEGGRIIMPLGEEYTLQTLIAITKVHGKLTSRPLVDVQFVPMLGEIRK